ncbi:MAG: glucose-1-phosphate adenylyltransferase [Clostridiales bacterium]|nr:glucose-1-phosphate adenylyltransferase [Clostridiales bacterium]
MKKKKCIAMLLAGGQGTRLFALTNSVAKPAVSFGAKYRIIDFPLSNCTNSGIDTVGVLTQYQPLVLNEYVGNGEPWDLDRSYGGVHTLPPYQAKKGGEWYKGTANAIYQNLHFLNEYDSEHVLILSGDHIYKMDYSKMLAEHIAHNADCTIAVIDVPAEEASRFGIMDYAPDKSVTSFEEKPKIPKSNHASMGIYIFKKDVLVRELVADEADKSSVNDFGKNIIPKMLAAKARMYAYQFDGYWKDVGTVTSLWEANMDLLGDKPAFDLDDPSFKIYSRNQPLPPSYIGETGKFINSIMTTGCEIHGTVINSVIGEGVTVGKGAVIENSIVMQGTVVGKNVKIKYGMIDEHVTIEDKAQIGDDKSDKTRIALVGRNSVIKRGTVVPSGDIVDNGGQE